MCFELLNEWLYCYWMSINFGLDFNPICNCLNYYFVHLDEKISEKDSDATNTHFRSFSFFRWFVLFCSIFDGHLAWFKCSVDDASAQEQRTSNDELFFLHQTMAKSFQNKQQQQQQQQYQQQKIKTMRIINCKFLRFCVCAYLYLVVESLWFHLFVTLNSCETCHKMHN